VNLDMGLPAAVRGPIGPPPAAELQSADRSIGSRYCESSQADCYT
jgi:hypothetical protein